jgi:hypothetical protein
VAAVLSFSWYQLKIEIMKNRIIIIGIALLTAAGFSACEKENSAPVYSTQAPGFPLTNGKWVVESFEVNGAEHNDFYTPYSFDFKPGGIVLVKGTAKEVNGRWSMGANAGYQSLQLDFGDTDPFSLLNNTNWKVLSLSPRMLVMKGSRGDDGSEYLTLRKL